MGKEFHASDNRKRARVIIFISDKIDLQSVLLTRDNEVYYIVIKV